MQQILFRLQKEERFDVMGVENVKGSPFNVQRSLHVPNLTYDEVKKMFQWYEKESGQKVEEKLYAIEVKFFTNLYLYRQALTKAAQYAKKLGIAVISLVFFIDIFDEKSREKFEVEYSDQSTSVKVTPIFIETGR